MMLLYGRDAAIDIWTMAIPILVPATVANVFLSIFLYKALDPKYFKVGADFT